MDFLSCPYRSKCEKDHLYCGLAESILKAEDKSLYYITDDTCRSCYKEEIPTQKKLNNTVVKILKAAAIIILKIGGIKGCSVKRTAKLLNRIHLMESINNKIKKLGCQCRIRRTMKREKGHAR